ncbi:conserved repeat domain protein [Paenibacillus curdlanolyticus YK9]|uniref:Conserved repeat domain protein n=1 Tax=Paenibacillus curdlanolyticus YK9 TaxID=717606 RepID=E0I508_9BACL|nr:DUF11 domain-containing protein [Paenibacillus curdlanolyticus]EFM12050.1 conserved repeat domain protein [Paenibacillus curdlanolyticus YK9]
MAFYEFGIWIDRASVRIDGQSIAIPFGLLEGIPIGSIASAQRILITYSALVDSLPTNAVVLNQAFIEGDLAPPGSLPIPIEIPSNIVSVPILDNQVRIVKKAGVSLSFIGSAIDYLIAMENGGGTDLTDVTLSDALPAGTRFVKGRMVLGAPFLTDSRATIFLQSRQLQM